MNCTVCGNELNIGARFCSNCGAAVVNTQYVPVQPRLMRARYGRTIAGVCAGFAQHYGWDVIVVRLVLCAAVLFGCGAPVLAYLAAWIIMPNEPHYFYPMQPMATPPVQPQAPAGTQPTA